jgi:hypothetical protein
LEAASVVLGGGAFGFWLGQQILKGLEYTGAEPPVGIKYQTPKNGQKIRVIATFKPVGGAEQTFDNVFDNPVFGPTAKTLGVLTSYGMIVGDPGTFVQYVATTPDLIEQPLQITSVTALDGSPAPGLRKVPGYLPQSPPALPSVPTTVPTAPGLPDFPITPTVVPNPANTPDEDDNTAKEPGVIVQIPELGMQVNFGPSTVTISRFRDPTTGPWEVPTQTPPPDDKKVAAPPCQCPEEENKSAEIICRLKALEKEILNDGYTLDLRLAGPAQCLSASGFTKEFRYLETTVAALPQNAKRIRYPEPGIDTVFCGNLQFTVLGVPGEVIPIRNLHQITVAPTGADGYVISGDNGFQLSVGAYLYTKKDYVDLCA